MAPSLSQKKFKIMVIYFFFYKICNKVICSSPLQAPVPILSSPLLSSPLLSSPLLSFPLFLSLLLLSAHRNAERREVWFVLQERLTFTHCLSICSLVPLLSLCRGTAARVITVIRSPWGLYSCQPLSGESERSGRGKKKKCLWYAPCLC